MYFDGYLYLLADQPYSTEELDEFIRSCGEEPQHSVLEETDGTLYWKGQPVTHTVYPMYLPANCTQMVCQREDLTIHVATHGQKQVCISGQKFYRCAQTNGKWVHPQSSHYITVGSWNQKVDVLCLEGDHVKLDTYVVTSDWEQENPDAHEFCYTQTADTFIITGVRSYYCERLHIPAVLDGKKVTRVFISFRENIMNLRELIVADGVEKLNFPWFLPYLENIQLPESLQLVCSPDGIRSTRWFWDQPDGQVYFQGYYCGTKGNLNEKELVIREGTIGICESADSDRKWERITFPASLTYIARGAFQHSDSPEQVVFPEGTEELKCYFSSLYPGSWNNRLRQWRGDHWDEEQFAELYHLGQYHPAIRAILPGQWMATAPRLSYRDGQWQAEYWYYTADNRTAGYYAAISVHSETLTCLRQLNRNTHPSFGPCWTSSYLSPYYLCAEDYLEYAAKVVSEGEPSLETLVLLERWWNQLPNDSLE